MKVAAELELYCFRESFDAARARRYHGLTPVAGYLEDYHILQTTKDEVVMRALRNGLQGAGIPVESSKGEWSRGQHEINFTYDAPLEMCDRHVLFKQGVKEMAAGDRIVELKAPVLLP